MIQKILHPITRLRKCLPKDLRKRRNSSMIMRSMRIQLPQRTLKRVRRQRVRFGWVERVCFVYYYFFDERVGRAGRTSMTGARKEERGSAIYQPITKTPKSKKKKNAPSNTPPSLSLCIIPINAGCFFKTLYTNGIIITTAAGGACNDNLANLFTNDASNVAGKCVELRNRSVRRKNLARCRKWRTVRSRKAYKRV